MDQEKYLCIDMFTESKRHSYLSITLTTLKISCSDSRTICEYSYYQMTLVGKKLQLHVFFHAIFQVRTCLQQLERKA